MSAPKESFFDPQSIEDWGPYQAPIDRHPILATIWFAIVCVFLLGLLAVMVALFIAAIWLAFRMVG